MNEKFQIFQKILKNRHSCRSFLEKPVPLKTLHLLFETAQNSASWCNTQPWNVKILSGAELKTFSLQYLETLKKANPHPDYEFPKYEGTFLNRRRDCGKQLYASLGISPGNRLESQIQAAKNYEFFGAPHVAIISSPKTLGVYGVMDCGGYVANLLNTAEALGLGAIAQGAIASHSSFVKKQLLLGEENNLICGVSIGYENIDHPSNNFRTNRENVYNVVQGLTKLDEFNAI